MSSSNTPKRIFLQVHKKLNKKICYVEFAHPKNTVHMLLAVWGESGIRIHSTLQIYIWFDRLLQNIGISIEGPKEMLKSG